MIRFVLMITSSMEHNRSVQWRRSPCALPSAVSSRRRMWHVSGVIFVKCFPFPFLPFSIPCVFNVLFPYISGIFLFMCDYWSCIIGWVCLTVAGELCSAPLLPPRPVYACTSHVQQPLYCFWCVSSRVTVTETGFSPFLRALLQNLTTW